MLKNRELIKQILGKNLEKNIDSDSVQDVSIINIEDQFGSFVCWLTIVGDNINVTIGFPDDPGNWSIILSHPDMVKKVRRKVRDRIKQSENS